MSELDLLWRDGSEIAVRDGDGLRRYSYVRRGSELLLTDGQGYWTVGATRASPENRSGSSATGDARVAPTDGRITSQMPGKVLDVRVQQGDTVAQGDVLLVLEAMKMEHALTAPLAGSVKQLPVTPGQRVMPGELLAEIEPA